MGNYNEKQQEAATIRERTVRIRLSDADVTRISEKAASVGLTVSELLENFIGDLTNGTYSNGSDERGLAGEWFARCGFGRWERKAFLAFLIERDALDSFLAINEELNEYRTDLQHAAEAEQDLIRTQIEEIQEELNEFYREYKDNTENAQPKEEAFKGVREYGKQLEEMRKGATL